MATISITQGDEIRLGFTTDIDIGVPEELKFALQKGTTLFFQKSVVEGSIEVDTTTHFFVTFNEVDTLSLPVGEYEIQALLVEQATSKKKSIQLVDGKISITKLLAFV